MLVELFRKLFGTADRIILAAVTAILAVAIVATVLLAAGLMNSGDAATSVARPPADSQPGSSAPPSAPSSAQPSTPQPSTSQRTHDPDDDSSAYPWHTGITATYFYGGEVESSNNNYQTNESTAWCAVWVDCFGGVDDPDNRTPDGFLPSGLTPSENSWYGALPCSEYNSEGLTDGFLEVLTGGMVPWANAPAGDGKSLLKNRWVEVTANGRTAFLQWEDTGPFEHPQDNDCGYVFGSGDPRPANQFGQHAGIDVSPAVNLYLSLNGSGTVDWRFVDEPAPGPWTQTETTSDPRW